MRQARNRQSRFLHLLDEILGTQANVRLLRVLALRRTPLTVGELARGACLVAPRYIRPFASSNALGSSSLSERERKGLMWSDDAARRENLVRDGQ
jgi:hypothetical protein